MSSPIAMAINSFQSERAALSAPQPVPGLGDDAFLSSASDEVQLGARKANVTVAIELNLDPARADVTAHQREAETAAHALAAALLAAIRLDGRDTATMSPSSRMLAELVDPTRPGTVGHHGHHTTRAGRRHAAQSLPMPPESMPKGHRAGLELPTQRRPAGGLPPLPAGRVHHRVPSERSQTDAHQRRYVRRYRRPGPWAQGPWPGRRTARQHLPVSALRRAPTTCLGCGPGRLPCIAFCSGGMRVRPRPSSFIAHAVTLVAVKTDE